MGFGDIGIYELDSIWENFIQHRLYEERDEIVSEWAVRVEEYVKESPSVNRVMYLMEVMDTLLFHDHVETVQAMVISKYYTLLIEGETPKMAYVLVKQLLKEDM